MDIFQMILSSALFLIAVFTCFYLPGRFLISKLNLELDFVENLFLSNVLGVTIFVFLSYILSFMNIFLAIIPVILVIDFLALKQKNLFKFKKIHFEKPLIIVLVLSIIFSFTLFFSGEFNQTIRLIGANKADAVWHLALVNELRNSFPPEYPNLSGVPLRSYHFFYDFLLAKINHIFGISPILLYFQFFPVLVALSWGFGTYVLVKKWTGKVASSLWGVFLALFGGSFGFIMHLQGHTQYSLDDVFGITQNVSALINSPFAISVVIIIAALFCLLNYSMTKNNKWLVPLILLAGMITLFKVHAGMILIGGLSFFTFLRLLKKDFFPLKIMIGVGVLFLGTFWALAGNNSFLVYAPLWAPHSVLISHFPWYGFEEKRYTYYQLNVIRGIIEIELYSLFVFVVGSLGTRILGLLFLIPLIFKKIKRPSYFVLSLIAMTAISIFIPLFFIQSVQPFDIIQMAWYFLFFNSLFAAYGFGLISTFLITRYGKIPFALFAIFVIVLTLSSAYEKYNEYSSFSKASYYDGPLYESIEFLRDEPYGVLIEMPGESVNPTREGISHWRETESSLALLAFGEKQGFLTRGYADFDIDKSIKSDFLAKLMEYSKGINNNSEEITNGLITNEISFIYSKEELSLLEKITGVEKVFENEAAVIYRFNN